MYVAYISIGQYLSVIFKADPRNNISPTGKEKKYTYIYIMFSLPTPPRCEENVTTEGAYSRNSGVGLRQSHNSAIVRLLVNSTSLDLSSLPVFWFLIKKINKNVSCSYFLQNILVLEIMSLQFNRRCNPNTLTTIMQDKIKSPKKGDKTL